MNYPDWFSRGACHPSGPGVFYPVMDSEYASDRKAREEKAKTVCSDCSVAKACLNWSAGIYGTDVQAGGVWGGMNEEERRRYKRRHLQRGQVAA